MYLEWLLWQIACREDEIRLNHVTIEILSRAIVNSGRALEFMEELLW